MSVNGINGNSNQPRSVGIQSAQSEGTVVRSTSTSAETESELTLSTQVAGSDSADGSEVPAPPTIEEGGSLLERYRWLQGDYERNQAKLQRLEELFERQDALEALAEIDETARGLLQELLQRRDLIPQLQTLIENEENEMGWLEGLADADLADWNPFSIDHDGDGLSDEYEARIRTDPTRIDTDGDGMTDAAEIWLQRHNLRFGRTIADPLVADLDRNGVPDGRQLPSSVRIDMPGNGRSFGASDSTTPVSGGGGNEGESSQGVGAQSEAETQFHPPSADAPHLHAGETAPDSTSAVVVNVSGDVTLSREDRNLIIETGEGRITIPYFDESGNPTRLVYFEGEPSSLQFRNLNPSDTQAVAGEDGYAVAGIYMASVPGDENVTYSYDPLKEIPFEDVDGVRRYFVDGLSGTFEIPEAIRGRVVKNFIVTETPEGIQLDLQDDSGSLLQRYLLVGGADEVSSHAIRFKGHDLGLRVVAYGRSLEFDGGAGDDIYEGLGIARGNGGDDWLVASGHEAVTFDGGAGNDNITGSDQADTLLGGLGGDIIYGGLGADTDTMRGGGGSDFIIGHFAEGNYNIFGDGGVNNTSNVFGPNVHDIQSGPQDNAVLEHVEELLAGDLSEERRAELERTRDITDIGRTETANRARDLVLGYLRDAFSRKEAEFGVAQGEEGFDADPFLPPPPGADDRSRDREEEES